MIQWARGSRHLAPVRRYREGLDVARDDTLHFFAFDEAEHLATGAYYRIKDRDHTRAVAALERALKCRD